EAGLDAGIRLERQAVLDGLPRDAEVVQRHEIRAVDPEQVQQLPQLVRRARGDDDARLREATVAAVQRRTEGSAVAWASNSRASPPSARSRRLSTRLRSNGSPSAVPWSSMYVPASVPT